MLKLIISQNLTLLNIWNLFLSNFFIKTNFINFYKYCNKFRYHFKNSITNIQAKKKAVRSFLMLKNSSKIFWRIPSEKKEFKKAYNQNVRINNLNFFNFVYFKDVKKFILKFNSFYKINPPIKNLFQSKNNTVISKKLKNSFYLYFQNLLNGKLKDFDKKYAAEILKNFKNKKNKFLILVYYLILVKNFKNKKSRNYLHIQI